MEKNTLRKLVIKFYGVLGATLFGFGIIYGTVFAVPALGASLFTTIRYVMTILLMFIAGSYMVIDSITTILKSDK